MKISKSSSARILISAAALSVIASASPASADGVAAPWLEGFNNKVRLIGGTASSDKDGVPSTYAGVEIAMPAGWKTYWRAPGESGVPPEFDWSGSENLQSATVLYPAPHRLIDKGGANIGYKDYIVFPVAIVAKDPAKPVTLKLKAAFGVCKELCVPVEAELDLSLPADAGSEPAISDVLTRVPRQKPIAATDPILAKWRIDDKGGKPILVLDVSDPGGINGDAFVDATGGTYLPLPMKLSDANGHSIYEVNLTEGADMKDLKGKPITVTLTGAKGQSETTITLP